MMAEKFIATICETARSFRRFFTTH